MVAFGDSAGVGVLVTTSLYTKDEEFDKARLVVNCLGDEHGERGTIISDASIEGFEGVLTMEMLGTLI